MQVVELNARQRRAARTTPTFALSLAIGTLCRATEPAAGTATELGKERLT